MLAASPSISPNGLLFSLHFSPQNNELLRDTFELGPPLVLDAATVKASKISRFEKVGHQRC